jgi:GTP-binding protein
LAGLPNVGKSLLFNKLTRTKNAIVSDHEGFTRDVRYGYCSFDDESECEIIDTAGFISEKNNDLADSVTFFTQNAIFEADNIVYIFDANLGIQLFDYQYLEFLRKSNKNVIPVINKCEGKKIDLLLSDFSELGFNEFLFISALHSSGIFELKEKLSLLNSENINSGESKVFKVGVIGKSNVGKSTLLNTILKQDRFITSSLENTTI